MGIRLYFFPLLKPVTHFSTPEITSVSQRFRAAMVCVAQTTFYPFNPVGGAFLCAA
jgi:hypothetical protein